MRARGLLSARGIGCRTPRTAACRTGDLRGRHPRDRAPGGTIANVGYFGKGDDVVIPRLGWAVGMAEKDIRTSLCPGGSERMLWLIETERVDPTPLTTHRFKLDQLERALEMMKTKEDDILKPLIDLTWWLSRRATPGLLHGRRPWPPRQARERAARLL